MFSLEAYLQIHLYTLKKIFWFSPNISQFFSFLAWYKNIAESRSFFPYSADIEFPFVTGKWFCWEALIGKHYLWHLNKFSLVFRSRFVSCSFFLFTTQKTSWFREHTANQTFSVNPCFFRLIGDFVLCSFSVFIVRHFYAAFWRWIDYDVYLAKVFVNKTYFRCGTKNNSSLFSPIEFSCNEQSYIWWVRG